jgi:thiosulfate dehydrogenase [quinone] large subunit
MRETSARADGHLQEVGMSRFQQVGLVVLRTLIGWHFVYEGYFKLALPGWGRDGSPLADWTAAGYLRAASGPFAPLFRPLAESPLTPWIDMLMPFALLLVGLSLMLGLLTQLGCWGALALLSLFYLSAVPASGVPQAGAEGAYLFVSKNLIEAAAVVVLLAFRTGRIAGLDLLLAKRTAADAPAAPAGAPTTSAA